MFEERLYVHCSRAEAIKFLKKYITKINGKIAEENTRHIVWDYRYKEEIISCKSEIIGLGRATEIITSSSNKTLRYKKAQIPIAKLYKELGKAFEITLSKKVDEEQKRKVYRRKPKRKVVQTNSTTNTSNLNYKGLSILLGIILIIILFFIPEGAMKNSVKNSAWDNSVFQVEEYLKSTLYYPDSFNPIEWSNVYDMRHSDYGYRYKVRVKYNAKDSYGVMVTESKLFYLTEDGAIVNVE